MTKTGSPRRRPHPARRARKVTGYASVAALLMLTGCMAATTKASTAAPTAAIAPASISPTTASTGFTNTTDSWGDDSYSSRRSSTIGAVAGTASAQPVTVTHAS